MGPLQSPQEQSPARASANPAAFGEFFSGLLCEVGQVFHFIKIAGQRARGWNPVHALLASHVSWHRVTSTWEKCLSISHTHFAGPWQPCSTWHVTRNRKVNVKINICKGKKTHVSIFRGWEWRNYELSHSYTIIAAPCKIINVIFPLTQLAHE